MKVCFVAPTVPWPLHSGGAIRTFNLIKHASRHAEIHLCAVRQPELDGAEARTALRPWCASIELFERRKSGPWAALSRAKMERWFHAPALREHLERGLDDGAIDVVHVDEISVARSLPRSLGVPVVMHHHKLDSSLARETAGSLSLDPWKLLRLEARVARRFRFHVACSDDDAAILRRRYPWIDCRVVQSGVDAEYWMPSIDPPARERAELLFLGTLSYAPNVDALEWFVREILPEMRTTVPTVKLRVVGSGASDRIRDLASPAVEIVGPREDVRPDLERCTGLVVPLRIGGGTRLKIVEALALGTPVVSTSIGAQGLALEPGRHYASGDGASGFAAAVRELFEHPREARTMAERGRALVLERYRWETLVTGLIDAWMSAMRAGTRRTLVD